MFPSTTRQSPNVLPPDAAGDRGAVLIMALLVALIVTLLGMSLATFGNQSVTAAKDEREADDALVAADAGLSHAKAILSSLVLDEWDAILQGGDGAGCTGDELAAAPPTLPYFPPAAQLIPAAGRAIGTGSYRVFVCDDHTAESTAVPPNFDPNDDANRRIKVRAVGTGRNGSTVTLEMQVDLVDMPALVVEGNLRVNGSQEYLGAAGAVYARGNLDLPGSPCAEQYFAAGGLITVGGSVSGGAGCGGPPDLRPEWEPLQLPVIEPSSFLSVATYRLGNDGRVRDSSGLIIGNNNWNGWNWVPGQQSWRGGSTIPPGVYYAQNSNIEIIGSPPSGPGTLALTLIADGWIDVSGSPHMVPALVGPPAVSIVAGTDIKLGGSASNPYSGLFYGKDQVEFSGTPTMTGQVIVRNIGDGPYPNPGGANPVQRTGDGYVGFNGNVELTYAGGNFRMVQAARWRECRQAGANPCGPA